MAIISSALLSIIGSIFNKKNAAYSGFSMLYNFILIGSACLVWGMIYISDFSFDVGVLPYSLGYGIMYALALIFLFKALECGPVSLTAMIKSISIITPSLWGFFFWGDTPTPLIVIGFVLVLLSLILCFAEKRKKGERGIPLKWFFYIITLAATNGGTLIVQKYQQRAFDGAHKNMLMFFATLLAALICLVFFLVGRKKNTLPASALKKSFYLPIIAGGGSATLNLLLMLLIPLLPGALIYPAIAVGALIITTLFSALACKERLRPMQWAGLGVGAIALVFLNL